ncbi:MAG: TatD family hydrolase, partial [Gammaproteobacteria bacterium]
GVFDAQLALAAERDLPAIVHSRKAVDQVWSHLRAHAVRAHIHSFAGSEQQAKRFVDLGCVLGIGATITFDRAQKLRRVVRAMPLDALCIETDAPDQPGQGHQGERHEPAWITEVVKTIAEVRGESAETIAEATFQNARRFFRLESVNVG